mmetsp:Transcript_1700/g.1180  ORF Transcript_1700/g.1180 Transcript_1700/m.1180 type:complete len:87 (+) Transcript_1700:100-360(+)
MIGVFGVYLIGTVVSYIIVIGEMFPSILQSFDIYLENDRIISILIFFTISVTMSYMLCYTRELTTIRYFSVIGVFTLIAASIVLFI